MARSFVAVMRLPACCASSRIHRRRYVDDSWCIFMASGQQCHPSTAAGGVQPEHTVHCKKLHSQPSIATGGALFTRRESSEGDLRGCASRLDLSNHVSVILSPRPKRSGCAQGDRLQVGNSVSVSHSCSERNGVIADAAYPTSPPDWSSSCSSLVKARGAKQ